MLQSRFECLFSMTLMPGVAVHTGRSDVYERSEQRHPKVGRCTLTI